MTSSWTTWSDEHIELPPAAAAMLQRELGPLQPPAAATAVADARVPSSQLPPSVRTRLVGVVGAEGVRDDDESRARHAGGQAYQDVVRRRHGDAAEAPDAVVLPGDADQVAAVLAICSDERIAVVPWGGGTSVVGGLDSIRGGSLALVALDLSRMNALLAVDSTSMLATFQPGIRTPDAEAALGAHGLTLGHVPQSFARASLGGYVVTRSAGQASTGVGRIDDLLAGLRMATPVGELALPALPASAAGPDLRRLVSGSEGTLGVVTELTLRVRRRPDIRRYEGWMLPDWAAGLAVMRRLAQDGPRPDVARLSDPTETTVSLAMSRSGARTRAALDRYLRLRRVAGGCLLITGYEGSKGDVRHRRDGVRDAVRSGGGVALGAAAGRSWEHARFAAPVLRDTLLDTGVLAETLETAATWTTLPGVYDAVRDALTRELGRTVVGCHVSHLYASGASLYFTVLAAAQSGHEIEQWTRAKSAANDAIVSAGGTITHHHAVGTAHRGHVTADLGGPVGVSALKAVKQALDPVGILNPGKLLPG
jgi:alkyldihydroxyacetonephosphate synthase